MDEENIFLAALAIHAPDQRAAFLDEACGDNDRLRQGVEALLRHHDDAGSFLEKPHEAFVATIATGLFDTVDDNVRELSLEFLGATDKPGCLGTLGGYDVIDIVGRGGMGLVLRAHDPKLNRVVAIKVIAPELATSPMAVKRFLREARAAAAVSHDHVVTIHAIDEDHAPPFIVMEYIDGQSLEEKIASVGGLELDEILRIGMQVARGLSAAHEQGLVHRDIKPANILLENGIERVKITDFGLARAVDDVSVTQTGQIAGTPQYMSPEQANGQPIDARSDLFSLGSVLYTMCTGCAPFRAATPVAILRRVADDDPRSIREANAALPEWLEAIVFKLLAKDPADRFESAHEVGELLGGHLAHLQHPSGAALPPRVAPPPKQKPKPKPKKFDLDEELSFVETSQRIYAWIAIGWAVLATAFAVVVFAFPGNYEATFFKLNAPWALATGVASGVTGTLASMGAWHVKRRRSYVRAVVGGVAALVPANPPLVFAIGWSFCALVKLRHPKVRQAFASHADPLKPAKPGPAPARSWPVFEAGLVVALFLILAVAAGVVIFIRTNNGTLRVVVNDPNTIVTIVDGQGIRFETTDGVDLTVRPGEHRLFVRQGALDFETDVFRVKRGEEVVISVEPIDGKLGARLSRPSPRGGSRNDRDLTLLPAAPSDTDPVDSAADSSPSPRRRFAEALGIQFAPLPAGRFAMGTAAADAERLAPHGDWFFAGFVRGRRQAERPQHEVAITRPFEMSKYEITVAQFRAFVEATAYRTVAEREGAGYGWRNGEWEQAAAFDWRNPGFVQADDHPVCNLAWDDAVAFCKWLSDEDQATIRLPTEAEWEYACRAGTTTLFSTGDDPESLRGAANLADKALQRQRPGVTWASPWDDGYAATAPVGSFAPNAFGLFDMHGNACEWCQDVYDSEWYAMSPGDDPLRHKSDGTRVFRGGGFDNWPGFLRSADRYSSHSDSLRTDWAGFRVVREE